MNEVYQAQRRVERRLAAAANVPEDVQEVILTLDTWRLAFAGTGLDSEAVTAALGAAARQMAPHGAIGAAFWLGYELGARA